ncbi:MAG TPA: hypothetical protein VGF75_05425, partial [Candidatus Saccharimonadales bacterium]
QPYGLKGENYSSAFTLLPGYNNIVSWFHFINSGGVLAAKSSKATNYTISVPANIKPGGYYASVLVKITPVGNSSNHGNNIEITQQLAEILFLQTPGPFKQTGKVVNWQFGLLQKPPIAGNLKFEDTGGVYYFPNIDITYSTIFGSARYNEDLVHLVIPNATRSFPISWSHSPRYGLFKVNGTISYGNTLINLPTRYVLVMSSGARIWAIAFLVVLVLLVTSYGFKLVRRRGHGKDKKN